MAMTSRFCYIPAGYGGNASKPLMERLAANWRQPSACTAKHQVRPCWIIPWQVSFLVQYSRTRSCRERIFPDLELRQISIWLPLFHNIARTVLLLLCKSETRVRPLASVRLGKLDTLAGLTGIFRGLIFHHDRFAILVLRRAGTNYKRRWTLLLIQLAYLIGVWEHGVWPASPILTTLGTFLTWESILPAGLLVVNLKRLSCRHLIYQSIGHN